jgi:hypothetical protein
MDGVNDLPKDLYRFPPTKWVGMVNSHKQFEKIEEELAEAQAATLIGQRDKEVLDMMQAIEGYLRIRELEGLDVAELFREHIEYTRGRGYYK